MEPEKNAIELEFNTKYGNNPSLDDYLNALVTIKKFEKNRREFFKEKQIKLNQELIEYFKNNLVNGIRVTSDFWISENFSINLGAITLTLHPPEDQYDDFAECYIDDKADSDIAAIGLKHGFKIKWVSWVYPK